MKAGRSQTLSAVMGSAMTQWTICGLRVRVPLHQEGTDRPGDKKNKGYNLGILELAAWVAANMNPKSSTKIIT